MWEKKPEPIMTPPSTQTTPNCKSEFNFWKKNETELRSDPISIHEIHVGIWWLIHCFLYILFLIILFLV